MLSVSSLDGYAQTCFADTTSSFGEGKHCLANTRQYLGETRPVPVDSLTKYLATIALGDVNAMGRFYRATISLVLARGRALVAKEDAEEIANDVYLNVWCHPLGYDLTRGSVQAWLSIMTRNRAIDCLRRRRFMVSLDDEQEVPSVETLLNPTIPTDILLEQHESVSVARRALSTLNPLQRQLLDLSFFQELSHQEIARKVGLPLGTIKSHLRRALHRLREKSPAYA